MSYETRQGRGYEYGGPAFPGGIIVGIGLGILLDDFFAWLGIGIGAGLILMGSVPAVARRCGPMIEPIADAPAGVLAVRAVGKVETADYENVLAPAVEAAISDRGKIRLVFELGVEFDGYTAGA